MMKCVFSFLVETHVINILIEFVGHKKCNHLIYMDLLILCQAERKRMDEATGTGRQTDDVLWH